MPETRTTVTVDGSPLGPRDLDALQSLSVEDELGSADKVSITLALAADTTSHWTSALDALVSPAVPFTVVVARGGETYEVDARSVAASWTISPGGLSTVTVEGLDRSVEMDREDVQRLWQDTDDASIAQTVFAEHQLAARVDATPRGADSDTYSPQQSSTDWRFLKNLAERNGFDVHVETVAGVSTGVFARVDATASPQARLPLGYGDLGGEASASVQLLAGQEVHVTRTVPGTADTDVAGDDGRGHAMGTQSLGGATVVRTHLAGRVSVVDAQTTATAMAERSAFGATLTTTLATPTAPLVRARRTVTVAGLGDLLNGLWLVRSVRHTITPGGHTQAISLLRNALGDSGVAGNGLAAAGASLAAAVGASL